MQIKRGGIMIEEFIEGFKSVVTIYYMGKILGGMFVVLCYILLATLLGSLLGWLDED